MSATLPAASVPRSNRGGRPVTDHVSATEALMEALAAIKCAFERREATARALNAIANAEYEEAKRLRAVVYPEIYRGLAPSERLDAVTV
jgi:hypothetical protein